MIPDESGAIVIPNNNFFSNRGGARPRWIVVHGTGGGSSAQGTALYFQGTQNTQNPVSSHYVIGQDGVIVQCVREADGAWANGYLSAGHDPWWTGAINPNNLTISIEHVKPALDNSTALTVPQMNASFRLIENICDRWGIPKRAADANGGITGHYSLDPLTRSRCPGAYPFAQLYSFLATSPAQPQEELVIISLTTSGVGQYFEQAPGNVWRCKQTGKVVGNAILDYYRKIGQVGLNGLTCLGLPVTNEMGVPGFPGCVMQRFERGVLYYDPKHLIDRAPGAEMVYAAHLYQGFGQDPRIDQLQASINSLQAQLKSAQQQNASSAQVDALKAKLKQINQLSAV